MKPAMLVLMFVVALTSAPSHSALQKAGFEVVSVKPNNVPGAAGPFGNGACVGGIPQIEPRRFAAVTTVYSLISWAYGVDCARSERLNLLLSKADWIRKDLFAVDALIPEGAPAYTRQQLRDGEALGLQGMIENLLADRFKLQIHRENRDLPIYALTLAKDGSKLRPFQEGSCDPAPARISLDQKPACDFSIEMIPGRTGRRTMIANGVTLNKFIQLLTLDLDRPVINQTGVTGLFDFRLAYTGATPGGVETNEPSLFTALQEQLGVFCIAQSCSSTTES